MKQPIIGISPRYAFYKETNRHFLQVNTDYIDQIVNRNAIPLILVPGPNLLNSLKMCDGILEIGGDDIDPKYYGETNDSGLSKGIDEETDLIDKEIIEYAIINKLPVLGICRGIQCIAAFLGGKLTQDIETDKLEHPAVDKKHYVERIATGNLSKLLPEKFLVNTFHHQAVKTVPEGFIATYKNADVIEAIEHKTLPIVAVQWHPERYYTKESEIIFDYFLEKVNEYRENNN